MQYVKERLELMKTLLDRDNHYHRNFISHYNGLAGMLPPSTDVFSGILSSVNYQGIRSVYTNGYLLATTATCTTIRENSDNYEFYSSNGQNTHSYQSNDDFEIKIIEWDMMDKWKFYPLSALSAFTTRSIFYPFTLVKTKMQIQTHNSVYKNMRDCFSKTVKNEGYRGLYKGFWVSAFQIFSGVFYVSTYEGVMHHLKKNGIQDSSIRGLIAGGCASVVGQTCIVPFDVISQHMMIVGMKQTENGVKSVYNPLGIKYEGQSKYQIAKDIIIEINRIDGFRGYYRGYLASLATYVPSSALWWGFYHVYQIELEKFLPEKTPHLLLQCTAAFLGGTTTTVLTNPLDVCRARLQVQRLPSFRQSCKLLWQEEGLAGFSKGLTARILPAGMFSVSIILGYESIKRLSVNEDYRHRIKW